MKRRRLESVSFATQVVADHAWDSVLKPNQRFKVLADFNDEAVLDGETQLVWEREPTLPPRVWSNPFNGAVDGCFTRAIANRRGWRLPTIEELSSLVDLAEVDPALSPGHPFINVLGQTDAYWSATSEVSPNSPSLVNRAYNVNFSSGGVGTSSKALLMGVWCVRGGQGHDGLVSD